jgi:hypothetical protein
MEKANKNLEEELEAAKFLMKQLVIGSDDLRGLVSVLLEDDKQPSEIVQLLSNGENSNPEAVKLEDVQDSSILAEPVLQSSGIETSGAGASSISPRALPVEGVGIVRTENSIMQPEESSLDDDSYIITEPATAATCTVYPSIPAVSNYLSTEIATRYTTGYTPVRTDLQVQLVLFGY